MHRPFPSPPQASVCQANSYQSYTPVQHAEFVTYWYQRTQLLTNTYDALYPTRVAVEKFCPWVTRPA